MTRVRDALTGLLLVVQTSRAAAWLHIHWHGGRPAR